MNEQWRAQRNRETALARNLQVAYSQAKGQRKYALECGMKRTADHLSGVMVGIRTAYAIAFGLTEKQADQELNLEGKD